MFGQSKRHGIDTDVLVTVYPSTSSVEDEWGGDAVGIPVKISIGYASASELSPRVDDSPAGSRCPRGLP